MLGMYERIGKHDELIFHPAITFIVIKLTEELLAFTRLLLCYVLINT